MLTRTKVSNLVEVVSQSRVQKLEKVAIIANHAPRQCGIASFTSDLADGVEANGHELGVFAVSDKPGLYDYPDRVAFEINEDDPFSYLKAARKVNSDGYDVVCVQHEYGIFGGDAGSYLLVLLRELSVPIVTTLHTVLDKPSSEQFRVMEEIVQRSKEVIVMSSRGKQILEKVHPSSLRKIKIIPHGVPDGSKVNRKEARKNLGLSHRKVVLTFGLLSRDKGIEQMIMAMDSVRNSFPDALYVVVGATHPQVISQDGESYRQFLFDNVENLDLAGHVMFVNEFVSQENLVQWIVSSDVYVCPYLKTEQVTSGTLSYAYGLGKPVVSTPNWHAQELLQTGGGVLVPPSDPMALSEAVISVLESKREPGISPTQDSKLSEMQWVEVARKYSMTFKQVVPTIPSLQIEFLKPAVVIPLKVNLSHLYSMSDDVGVMQHGMYNMPRRSDGYCTDDNARALILVLNLSEDSPSCNLSALEKTYLSFIAHAFESEHQTFHNFMGFDRRWLDEVGSNDCQGRAVWALGHVAAKTRNSVYKEFASTWLNENADLCVRLDSLRSIAYCILGLDVSLRSVQSSTVPFALEEIASRLVREFRQVRTSDWPWFESVLAYDNARLPQALLIAARVLGDDIAKSEALESLEWLCRIQTGANGCFVPIGSNGFFSKSGERAVFDQQPIEASATVEACLDAFGETGNQSWLNEAERAWNWFDGNNLLGIPLTTIGGGCYDGLMVNGVNQNQGAESTICYLSALRAMRLSRSDYARPSGTVAVI